MSETLVPMSKDADYLEVHPTTVASHKLAGWVQCEAKPQEPTKATKKAPAVKAEAPLA